MSYDLEIAFKEAVKKVSETEKKLAPDTLLRLYGFYKQATSGNHFSAINKETEIRNAFKFNAWVQLRGMNREQAMQAYIDFANEIL